MNPWRRNYMNRLRSVDSEAAALVEAELKRQNTTLELIASENFVYEAILEAQGSIMTNKYAEGYPGKRYHGGCEHIDLMEDLARQRACQLFKADHANVQPHSGVNANLAAYMALIQPGDTILGMFLQHGGHLSHGSKVSITGSFYRSFFYGVNPDTELIDYDEVRSKALEHKPRLIIAGGSAYSRTIDFSIFREIADEAGALFLVDMAHIAGLIAAGVHPSPVEYADIVTSTTTKTMRGARGGFILCGRDRADAVDRAVFPGTQGGPILQNVLAKAVTFKMAMQPAFRQYQEQVVKNADLLAQSLRDRGLRIVTGGTDNHLLLVDLQPANLTGHQGEIILEELGITVNKNMIPFDPRPPAVTSGIRMGTAAITSRGMKEDEITEIASIIAAALGEGENLDPAPYRQRVMELCRQFPLYLDPLEFAAL